jgi:hypothetical protein
MKRYTFQPLVTLDPSATGAAIRAGQPQRMVVRGEIHETHGRQLFSALVARPVCTHREPAMTTSS